MSLTDTTRAYTKEEVCKELLRTIRDYVSYWANVSERPIEDRLDGLVFSILNIFDGSTIGLPAFDISPSPHPEDAAYNQARGDNWYEPGMVINDDVMLHELWSAKS